MRRSLSAVVTLLLVCTALAAPAPRPFTSGWENDVNPDRDCKFIREKGALTIEMPGSDHDYDPKRRCKNAPRLLRDIEGEFVMEVRVRIVRRPSGKSTVEGRLSWVSAGFLVILPDSFLTDFVRFELGVVRKGSEEESFAALREKSSGGGLAVSLYARGLGNAPLLLPKPTEPAYLRLERKGEAFISSISLDGKKWTRTGGAGYMDLPAKCKVGLAAYSTSTEPSTVRFDEFKLIQGKKKKD